MLENCILCPRKCGVNRFKGGTGFCKTDAGFNIASVCIHRGEEPAINGRNGICNIFFTGCNLRCIYCQNHDISNPDEVIPDSAYELQTLLDRIEKILSSGINSVGFVSPSHVVPQVREIIRGLNSRGLKPVTVYNTNSYDRAETLRSLSDVIDVYLPDIKYVTSSMAFNYSEAADYPEIAVKALKEMYYQKGSGLRTSDDGSAEYGMVIRHLVLPGHIDESIRVLEVIAEELSPGVTISLMSQYYPTGRVKNHAVLNRQLLRREYDAVAEAMQKLGFRNGWVQDMDSCRSYLPDFRQEHPFEY
ncbi:MAG: 4Fe-4S cluster-binding domain-containing protein [Bacteroidales bacterium]|nr:4Fe-4S cluster-binding domain-containing protein [Bacteroidales bacterium]